jgi:prepilin-type N-terminal cleavage/methylation domain-containing protein
MNKFSQSGFTLIELITVLVLLGIIGGFSGLILVKMVQSYQWADDNAHLTQKAQVALTRIAVEMVYATRIDSGELGSNVILYNAEYPDGTEENDSKFELEGSRLEYFKDGSATSHALVDNVVSFEIDDADINLGYVKVTLRMIGANEAPQTFEQTMAMPSP